MYNFEMDVVIRQIFKKYRSQYCMFVTERAKRFIRVNEIVKIVLISKYIHHVTMICVVIELIIFLALI